MKAMKISKKGICNNTGRTHFKKGDNLGKKNIMWKGDSVGYHGLHKWVIRHKGNASDIGICSVCSTRYSGKYEWANLSHKYKRDIDDWACMCASCHQGYDSSRTKMWKTRRANART